MIVRDGVYSASSADELVVITRSGTADAPITFRAEWELNGNNNAIATAVKFEGCSYVRFEDFNVHDFGASSGGSCTFGSMLPLATFMWEATIFTISAV